MTHDSNPRLVMHVDMDAFFAAIEELDDPRLRGLPVVVGARPGTRGVVSTCNYEARRYGIHSAMPISEAHSRCPGAMYLRPRMKRYTEMSHRVMEALRTVSPVVEPVSVDEAFVDVTGLEQLVGSPEAIGRKAKEAVLGATRLTCSVGIGPNRLIVKIASDLRKPDGLTVVAPEEVLDFLAPLEVSRLRGVGKVLLRKLESFGIRTVADVRKREEGELAKLFGESTGGMLHRQARGIASDAVGGREERKSISKETTFNRDVTDLDVLRRTLREHAAEVGRTARRLGLQGRCVTVKVRLQGFETHTRSKTLKRATDIDDEIFRQGWRLYEGGGFGDRPVRLIGVGISEWDASGQMELFAGGEHDGDRGRKKNLMAAKDRIVARFGKKALGFKPPPTPRERP